ncbi:secreted RxLR effector protein 161-like [Apium graveolens]|uniref:secreted RxLR effector protein 161-like n=1 Tax=Apium graveolens TaxID=4045 RepID=UPI003D7B7C87
MGLLSYYVGIEVKLGRSSITLMQITYAKKILEKMWMIDCNLAGYPMEQKMQLDKDEGGQLVNVTEHRSIFESLRYLTHTRPDISYVVGVVSRFMEAPTTKYQQAVKHILRYIQGTVDHGLEYEKTGSKRVVIGFSDSDLACDIGDRRSTGGMCFYLDGNLVCWASQKQGVIALSSCEAEYMAATTAVCHSIWLRGLLAELIGQEVGAVTYARTTGRLLN